MNNIIYKIQYGSDIYGTTTADSDNDIRGIYLPTITDHLSLREFKTITELTDEYDLVLHPFKKYIKLAAQCNPSCLEWLFVPRHNIIESTPAGWKLRNNRKLFLSKQIYHRFRGFALSELKRVDNLTGRAGDKRKKLFARYGYDPKAAMNVVRLLGQGIELLTYHDLTMPRPNCDYLREVKLGQHTKDSIHNYINRLLKEIDTVHSLHCTLPERADINRIDELLTGIILNYAG